jgi:hypothetical protein
VGNAYRSPEADKNVDPDFAHLPFEVKRSLARCYSFVLMLRGTHDAFIEFTRGQDQQNKLDYPRFQALHQEALKLGKEVQEVVRATAFLIKSPQMTNVCQAYLFDDARLAFRKNNLSVDISSDSEEFLSQFAVIAAEVIMLTPITSTLNESQRSLLLKAFWPNTHMRWLYSTEGGCNMTRDLQRGIQCNRFNHEVDFAVWLWRWRLNVAGLEGGPGAKFYDKYSDQLIEATVTELMKLFDKPEHQFLHDYLLKSASDVPGLLDLEAAEKYFIGHIIAYLAYFHRVDLASPVNLAAIMRGYSQFKHAFDEKNAAANAYIHAIENENAVTPTYVPGVMDKALGLIKIHYNEIDRRDLREGDAVMLPDKFDISAVFKEFPMNTPKVIERTVQFMSQFMSVLYSSKLEKRISCMSLANTENLRLVLQSWLQDPASVQFGFDGKMEMTAAININRPIQALNL